MTQKIVKTMTGKLKISVPDDLGEISMGQLAALQENPTLTDLEAISILSGVPLPDLMNVKDVAALNIFIEATERISTQIPLLFSIEISPSKIVFPSGKIVKVPADLSIEPAGAFMAAKDIISDEVGEYIRLFGEKEWHNYYNPSIKSCCHVLAHYFYCKTTGNVYNEFKVEEFLEEIKKLKAMEALPIARHFFYCYPALSKLKTSFFQRLLRYSKKRLGYNPLKNSNISTPSTLSQAVM